MVDYRNPRIADAMKVLGIVQRFGLGIQTAQAEMAGNANPPIEFKADHAAVVCVLHPAIANVTANATANVTANVSSGLTELQHSLLKEIKRDPSITYDKLASIVNRNRLTIVRNFKTLRKAGILDRIGSDKTGKWVVVDNRNMQECWGR